MLLNESVPRSTTTLSVSCSWPKGTDCGLGTRVGHGSICWAKFEALVAGAKLASKQLWA